MRTAGRPGGEFVFGGRPVARIGYGAGKLAPFGDDPEAGVAVLQAARDLGVDHVDTAQFYGDGVANDIIRRALGDSDEVAIVTKVGAAWVGGPVPITPAQRPSQLRQQIEDNLRSLGRERIDVVNLRRLDTGPGLRAEGDQVVDIEDQLAELAALRDAGVVGAIGLSGIDEATLRRSLPVGVACVQNAYSVLSRDDEDLWTICRDEGIAWVPFWPLGGSLPAGVGDAITRFPRVQDDQAVRAIAAEVGATPAQVGLAWLLGHGPNVLVIPGTARVDHLRENVAVAAVRLSPEQMATLDALGDIDRARTTVLGSPRSIDGGA